MVVEACCRRAKNGLVVTDRDATRRDTLTNCHASGRLRSLIRKRVQSISIHNHINHYIIRQARNDKSKKYGTTSKLLWVRNINHTLSTRRRPVK